MRIKFYGPSWVLGAGCAAVYYGHISPWWLLVTPLLFIEFKSLTFPLITREPNND